MRKIVLLIVGCAMVIPAFAELQNVDNCGGLRIRQSSYEQAPSVLPPVDYSTVSTETKVVEVKSESKSALQNITVDGSIRVRYSVGDRPSFSTQRIALNYRTEKVAAGLKIQQYKDF